MKKRPPEKRVVFAKLKKNSLALGELGGATSGLQTVLLTLGSRNPLWRNGLRTRVFKIAVLIATLFIVVSLFYTSSRLYRDTNKFYDIMVTWTIL
jgi:hypothetical protein